MAYFHFSKNITLRLHTFFFTRLVTSWRWLFKVLACLLVVQSELDWLVKKGLKNVKSIAGKKEIIKICLFNAPWWTDEWKICFSMTRRLNELHKNSNTKKNQLLTLFRINNKVLMNDYVKVFCWIFIRNRYHRHVIKLHWKANIREPINNRFPFALNCDCDCRQADEQPKQTSQLIFPNAFLHSDIMPKYMTYQQLHKSEAACKGLKD